MGICEAHRNPFTAEAQGNYKGRVGAAGQPHNRGLNPGSEPGSAGFPVSFPSDPRQYQHILLDLYCRVLIRIFRVLCPDS